MLLATVEGLVLQTESGLDIEIATPTPLRTAVLNAVVARLQEVIPDVKVERVRRAPTAKSEMPLLVVVGSDTVPDESQMPQCTFWTFGVTLIGYVWGESDQAAEDATSLLHARVMEALQMAELGDHTIMPTAGPAEMQLTEVGQSAAAIGQMTAAFSVLATARTGYPYAV